MLDPDFSVAIPALVKLGCVSGDLWAAYDVLTDMLVAGRLLAPDGKEPPPAAAKALARACQCDSYAALCARIADARKAVARSWAKTFEQELELD